MLCFKSGFIFSPNACQTVPANPNVPLKPRWHRRSCGVNGMSIDQLEALACGLRFRHDEVTVHRDVYRAPAKDAEDYRPARLRLERKDEGDGDRYQDSWSGPCRVLSD